MTTSIQRTGEWPVLTAPGWQESRRTLHLWSQVVGKTRLALMPMENHWWQVTLRVTARGLSSAGMPHRGNTVDVDLDLLAQRLEVRSSDGRQAGFPLDAPTLAEFYARYLEAMSRIGVELSISPLATEIAETIYLDRDRAPRSYQPEWGTRFFSALRKVDHLFRRFRAPFVGKASPVHFFWGGFDLAVTRFSGRTAPRHPGGVPHCADRVMHEAYSHEVSSAGFWPGGPGLDEPAFYAYAYPEPAGFRAAPVAPAKARFDPTMGEFILPYEAVRTSPTPDQDVLEFLESTYRAAADLGHWNRAEIERPPAGAGRG
jgi:hypothetical protein